MSDHEDDEDKPNLAFAFMMAAAIVMALLYVCNPSRQPKTSVYEPRGSVRWKVRHVLAL